MNFGSPEACRSFNSWVLTPSFFISQLVRGYFTGSKNTRSGSHHKVPEPAAYYWKKRKKRDSWKCLFVIFSVSPVLQGTSLHPTCGIVLQNPGTPTWPEWEMSPILLPWKEQLCWRSVVCLSFSPVGSGRKHLSPLSSAQIRCLYLFRVEEINPEWSTVGRGARKRWWKEGKHNEAAWFSFACVCPCEQMAFIGKPSLLSRETGALTPCYNPLPATFPASTCPPPAPIHSH